MVTEKSGGVVGGERECGDVCSRIAGERKTAFGYFACEKKKRSCLRVKCLLEVVGSSEEDCGIGVC